MMIAWNCNRLYFDLFIKINTYIPLNIVQIQKLAIEKKHTVSTYISSLMTLKICSSDKDVLLIRYGIKSPCSPSTDESSTARFYMVSSARLEYVIAIL
jgi:hypothetical protein